MMVDRWKELVPAHRYVLYAPGPGPVFLLHVEMIPRRFAYGQIH